MERLSRFDMGVVAMFVVVGVFCLLVFFQGLAVSRNQAKINHVQKKSDCWSHVLDVAVQTKPSPTRTVTLHTLADRCAKLK